MPKNILAAFFRRAIPAALPLLIASCNCTPQAEFQKTVQVDGGLPDALSIAECHVICNTSECSVASPITDAGTQTVTCSKPAYCSAHTGQVEGRRTAGLDDPRPLDGSPLGAHFARAFHFESGSVPAFRRLARELAAHGAPSSLVARALSAARDELRHARAMRKLARQFGAPTHHPSVAPCAPRPLEEVARENSVEGCVNETFAALIASWQSRAAGHSAVRATLRPIARDEQRHAELAWECDAWFSARLSPAARGRVAGARDQAVADLAAALSHEPHPDLIALAGVPSRRVAAHLYAETRAALWT
jgi:hypothetical protein